MSQKGNAEKEMTFWDHLEDLRGGLIRSIAVLLVASIVLFFFKNFLFDDLILGRLTYGGKKDDQ